MVSDPGDLGRTIVVECTASTKKLEGKLESRNRFCLFVFNGRG